MPHRPWLSERQQRGCRSERQSRGCATTTSARRGRWNRQAALPATSIPAVPAWDWLVEPCLPSPAKTPPSGLDRLHEIKHDGFRILALRDANAVRLITRNGQKSPRFILRHEVRIRTPAGLFLAIDVGEREAVGVLDDVAGWPFFNGPGGPEAAAIGHAWEF
jgi:hypothetical protein